MLAVARHAAAQHTVQLEMRQQQHELLAGELDRAVGQGAGEVSSGAIGCLGEVIDVGIR